jgi:hypothetical protein
VGIALLKEIVEVGQTHLLTAQAVAVVLVLLQVLLQVVHLALAVRALQTQF